MYVKKNGNYSVCKVIYYVKESIILLLQKLSLVLHHVIFLSFLPCFLPLDCLFPQIFFLQTDGHGLQRILLFYADFADGD